MDEANARRNRPLRDVCAGRGLFHHQLADVINAQGIGGSVATITGHVATIRRAFAAAGGFDPMRTVAGSGYMLGSHEQGKRARRE